MGKGQKGRKSASKHRGDGGFIQVTREVLHSAAYKDLSNAARVALLLIQDDYRPDKKPTYLDVAGQTHEDLICTFEKASDYMRKETFSRAVLELVEHGFIEVWQFGNPVKRINFYRCVEKWKLFGTPSFIPQKVDIQGEGKKTKRVYNSSTVFSTGKGDSQYAFPYRDSKKKGT